MAIDFSHDEEIGPANRQALKREPNPYALSANQIADKIRNKENLEAREIIDHLEKAAADYSYIDAQICIKSIKYSFHLNMLRHGKKQEIPIRQKEELQAIAELGFIRCAIRARATPDKEEKQKYAELAFMEWYTLLEYLAPEAMQKHLAQAHALSNILEGVSEYLIPYGLRLDRDPTTVKN